MVEIDSIMFKSLCFIQEQYVYLHEAVADAMLFGTHMVWTRQFGDVLTFMMQKEKADTRSRLQIQFEVNR